MSVGQFAQGKKEYQTHFTVTRKNLIIIPSRILCGRRKPTLSLCNDFCISYLISCNNKMANSEFYETSHETSEEVGFVIKCNFLSKSNAHKFFRLLQLNKFNSILVHKAA